MDNIITRASSVTNSSREVLVKIESEGGHFWARPAPDGLFALFSKDRCVVRRQFVPPQTVQGNVTQVLNRESGENHEMVPTITVRGVVEEKLLKAAALFFAHYEEQESFLKNKVDEFLKRYINTDSDPLRALFEPGVNRTWDYYLARDVREELGLDVSVTIADDPVITPWIAKIRGHPARPCSFSFRPLNSGSTFTLTLSFRITGVAFKHWNALRNRGKENLPLNEEMNQMEARMRVILAPVFSSFPRAALASSHGGFWKAVEQLLTQGVGEEIEKEFGCKVEITNLLRGKSEVETSLDKGGDPEIIADLQKFAETRRKALDRYAETLEAMDFQTSDPNVIAAQEALDDINDRFKKLREKIVAERSTSIYENFGRTFDVDDMKDSLERTARLLMVTPRTDYTALLLSENPAQRQQLTNSQEKKP